ncbi:MAG TPA: PhnD/SsuA/transferrin family substrate-binding protein [Candidatus Saccharimonadaceae bacterium]|jgi:ABC-type phosphate/phosphonate transport system substrate-binding protein|nr:PhnD/SsuA/transferrin family substrate-binding protein [Candidatus Saccharimonadaceae bacterium]
MRPTLVGAVLYDPKVAVIWDVIARYFVANGCRMDCVFYTNYELQVEALVADHIDIAWNSPLAWVDAQRRTGGGCRAVAMRDTDRDRRTHLLVAADGPVRATADLHGKSVAFGAADSPQATLLPQLHLIRAGLTPGQDFAVRRHDVLVGKHGDHVGGERDALESMLKGESAAAAVLDLNWDLWSRDGTCDPDRVRVLTTTPAFDHCNFTVTTASDRRAIDAWTRVLLAMDYANPDHREMMDLEGLKAWLPGRTSGYADLTSATETLHYFETVRA